MSFRFTRLAGLVKSTLGIREIARPVLQELAEQTEETVSIHAVSDRNRVCLDSVTTSSAPLRAVVQAGEQIPLLVGSASKVLMAYMPKAQLTPLVKNVAKATKRTNGAVLEEFAMIREQGYAVSHGERLLGISAISVPIKDVNQEVHYCLSVGAPTVRMNMNEKEFIELAIKGAEVISRQFGGEVALPAPTSD